MVSQKHATMITSRTKVVLTKGCLRVPPEVDVARAGTGGPGLSSDSQIDRTKKHLQQEQLRQRCQPGVKARNDTRRQCDEAARGHHSTCRSAWPRPIWRWGANKRAFSGHIKFWEPQILRQLNCTKPVKQLNFVKEKFPLEDTICARTSITTPTWCWWVLPTWVCQCLTFRRLGWAILGIANCAVHLRRLQDCACWNRNWAEWRANCCAATLLLPFDNIQWKWCMENFLLQRPPLALVAC